jgi:hypothetical protein
MEKLNNWYNGNFFVHIIFLDYMVRPCTSGSYVHQADLFGWYANYTPPPLPYEIVLFENFSLFLLLYFWIVDQPLIFSIFLTI